jgi:hypothetical protein
MALLPLLFIFGAIAALKISIPAIKNQGQTTFSPDPSRSPFQGKSKDAVPI